MTMKSTVNLMLGVAIGTAIGYKLYPNIEGNNLKHNLLKNMDIQHVNIGQKYFSKKFNKYSDKIVKSVTGGFYPSVKLPSTENLILRESYLSSVSFRDKIPNWVAEKISNETCSGKANRADCVFQVDPDVPLIWSAENKDYFASGYSRGHMAAAGQHKNTETAQSDTFYLSGNILPQDLSNNGADWYRLELISRELTNYYQDVYVVSGPLFAPNYMRSKDFKKLAQNLESIKKEDPPKDALGQICVIHKKDVLDKARELGDEKKMDPNLIVKSDLKDTPVNTVTYEVIGDKLVSAPPHLFKVILAVNPRKEKDIDVPPVAFGSFIMKNEPESERHLITEYMVPLKSIEISTGLDFSGLKEFTINYLKANISRKDFKKLLNHEDLDKFENMYSICNVKDTLRHGKSAQSICNDEDSERVKSWRYLGYIKLSKTKKELEDIWNTIKSNGYDKENFFLRKEYVNKCKSLGIEPEKF
ncbi:DNA/RNA non-specific endonuclease [Cryptosporidium hominis]|uniref:DNA/RNA non-specific endonuclease n=1 Tax=Cryptosporidium hominis TaxID=237895 RepID=A0ABX5BH67_CRYHO|nr:endonuclease G-like 1 [Cryptosporidium hominis TU502]PPS96709.1 DNA/RNA non-specific endonuclease [Cryptosporidium hominis]|eukprot:PPS96709.1 DNA/RNA non-specific endonuclease [Cryptosporidium hominis]